jgi:hypothetical protein
MTSKAQTTKAIVRRNGIQDGNGDRAADLMS